MGLGWTGGGHRQCECDAGRENLRTPEPEPMPSSLVATRGVTRGVTRGALRVERRVLHRDDDDKDDDDDDSDTRTACDETRASSMGFINHTGQLGFITCRILVSLCL